MAIDQNIIENSVHGKHLESGVKGLNIDWWGLAAVGFKSQRELHIYLFLLAFNFASRVAKAL